MGGVRWTAATALLLAAALLSAGVGSVGLDEAFAVAGFADSAVAFADETPPDPSIVFATPGGR